MLLAVKETSSGKYYQVYEFTLKRDTSVTPFQLQISGAMARRTDVHVTLEPELSLPQAAINEFVTNGNMRSCATKEVMVISRKLAPFLLSKLHWLHYNSL